MPPSLSMRLSPRRELRVESHRRGHSLGSGILSQEKDDDLALFNEVQNRERETFLLQSNDFEDISTQLRQLSDYNLGISIPARGESSDLLNAEGDKNDYDWLITPPDTPLFPSLDDETLPTNLARRGRPRSQPHSISSPSMVDKSYRDSRASASPNRLSPSPRSGMLQSRGRPSSAPHASPPPSLRHPNPVRRPSPPPSKPSTPNPRSRTPTPRRMSTGSAGATAASRVRGTSPVKTPKNSPWQSNIQDFSLETPSNLCTSLADRSASYVRGSSPASRKGFRSGRQSMSPTPSRSVSSPHSRDQDPFSSHSKGSVASSGDDDLDSPQSISMSSLDRSALKNIGAFPNNRALGFAKKSSRNLSTSSAPKRSFDLALQQMDRRRSPHNMFRPLLSSVPSSTFYVVKASTAHHLMTFRTSSITTSSNTNSDKVTSGVHDYDESEQNQDVPSECVKRQHSEAQEEVFVLDDCGTSIEDVKYNCFEKPSSHEDGEFDGHLNTHLDTARPVIVAPVVSETKEDHLYNEKLEDMAVCSKCGLMFHSALLVVEGDLHLCSECKSLETTSTMITAPVLVTVSDNTPGDFVQILKHGPQEALDSSTETSESLQATITGKSGTNQPDMISNVGPYSYRESSLKFSPYSSFSPLELEEGKPTITNRQLYDQSTEDNSGHQHVGIYSCPKVDVSEGAKTSSSSKDNVQSRSFTMSNMSYDDFSCVEESLNSMRSSIVHGSTSMSSSVDLGSLRQIDSHVQRRLNDWKSDIENYRFEILKKHQRSLSSLSGASSYGFQVLCVGTSFCDDSVEFVASNVEKDVKEAARLHLRKKSLTSECTEAESMCTDFESNNILRTASELSGHVMNIHIADTPVVTVPNFGEPASQESSDSLINNPTNCTTIEASSTLPRTCTMWEDATPNSCNRVGVVEGPNGTSLDVISETEVENGNIFSPDSQSDIHSVNSKSGMEVLLKPTASEAPNHDTITFVQEPKTSNPVQSNLVAEESALGPEDQGQIKARSLTLEEATDTILFCSSIVHNLVYEAANIAMEKENLTMKSSQLTLILAGKSDPGGRGVRARPTGKHISESQNARYKRPEDTKPPYTTAGKDEKSDFSTNCIVGAPNNCNSMKPMKLESKCNCTIM